MDKLFIAAIKEETIDMDFFKHVGVGKINATYNTLKLIQLYRPKIVINYGTAGAINKNLQGIIECTKFYQRDMDVTGLGFEFGQTPYEDNSTISFDDNGYSCGTGDNFVMSKPKIETDLVDMESYAYAKFCKEHSIDFLCYKYISDNADKNAPKDWPELVGNGADAFLNMEFINGN